MHTRVTDIPETTLSLKDRVKQEIDQLVKENDGKMIVAEDWVEFAKDEDTASHQVFNWDNAAAGHQWRLQQARQYLHVYVTVVPNLTEPVRAFVSLSTDRHNGSGGGFRPILTVLSNKDWYAQLLEDAMHEAELFSAKYSMVKELARVFKAIDAVKKARKKS